MDHRPQTTWPAIYTHVNCRYTRQMKTHTLTADIDHIHGPQTPDNMACYIHTRQLQIRASTADIVTHVK